MIKSKFKKGDRVIVISGDHSGSTGVILQVMLRESKVIIQGVNMRKKRKKSKISLSDNDMVEYPIHSSNVLHSDPKTFIPTKIGYRIVDGKKVRYSKSSGEQLSIV